MKNQLVVCISLGTALLSVPAFAQTSSPLLPQWLHSKQPTSLDVFDAFHSGEKPPAAQRATAPLPLSTSKPAVYPNEFRRIDGSHNAPGDLGMAGTPDLRNVTNAYGDGIGSPAGADRLSPRVISNIVCAQPEPIQNSQPVSGFIWNWGNLIDHDMTLTRVGNPPESFNIPVPQCDPIFDPKCKGTVMLPFKRSSFSMVDGVRQQIDGNTAFLDGSVVYGSDLPRAKALRTFSGGHLMTGDNNLLPLNTSGLANQPDNSPTFFFAGDVRANENVELTCMQTLFMREHNYWADTLAAGDPTLTDEDLYQRAKAIVTAEIQCITYRDFIPVFLGPNALTPYAGYNPAADPRVSIAYSTAAFRVGHTFVPPVLDRLNKKNVLISELPTAQSMFDPTLVPKTGIEPYLRGLARQVPQEVDGYIIDSLRNFQIGGQRAQGFDLASLNIQRGRDHGLPSYNQVRIDYGLAPKTSFADMTSNIEFQTRLAQAYSSPDDVDLWVGGLVEDHYNGGLVGETFFTILKEQLQRTRDADRFWYEVYLDPDTLALVQAQTLSGIIRRNTTITTELQDDAFHVPTE